MRRCPHLPHLSDGPAPLARSRTSRTDSAINTLHRLIVGRIRDSGALTVADYMELALYHPEHGYYATSSRRSGAHGDFYTSVDAGPLFGAAIAVQIEEMWGILRECGASRMHVVEAGASDGRLTRDILDAAASHHPALYAQLEVTPVERSAAARARHPGMLAAHAARYAGSRTTLPSPVTGVIIANELLDALPVHVVVGGASGPREIHVGERDGTLVEIEGPLSSPAIAEYVERERVELRPGARAEIGLRAIDWISEAADALQAGFLLLFDYGLPAAALYSDARAAGTLTAYRRHTSGIDSWLRHPGEADITSQVNLTAITRAAESAGLVPMGITDQTYFLLQLGIAERVPEGHDAAAIAARLAAKTLLVPGGLGSTMKALAFGTRVPQRALRGFSSARLT